MNHSKLAQPHLTQPLSPCTNLACTPRLTPTHQAPLFRNQRTGIFNLDGKHHANAKPPHVLLFHACAKSSHFWVWVGWKIWHFDAKSDPNLLLFTVMKTHLLLLNLWISSIWIQKRRFWCQASFW
jgi:hypothetical protein